MAQVEQNSVAVAASQAVANGEQNDLLIPALLAAAQAGFPSTQKVDNKTARSYQYHPYDPKKKLRANAARKKRRFGVTTFSSPPVLSKPRPSPVYQKYEQNNVSDVMPRCKEKPFTCKQEVPSLMNNPLDSIPSSTPIAASYDQLMFQYTQNQLQQQTLIIQQTLILQQLQGLKAIDNNVCVPNDSLSCSTAPTTPVSFLSSPGPFLSTTPNCNVNFDLFNCGSPLPPLSPLSSFESEPDTPTSQGDFAFDLFSSLGSFDTCNKGRRLSGASDEGISNPSLPVVSTLDVNGIPCPNLYAGVNDLFVDLNQNMQSW